MGETYLFRIIEAVPLGAFSKATWSLVIVVTNL